MGRRVFRNENKYKKKHAPNVFRQSRRRRRRIVKRSYPVGLSFPYRHTAYALLVRLNRLITTHVHTRSELFSVWQEKNSF